MYSRIKDNHNVSVEHASKEYQVINDTDTIYYRDYVYYYKHRTIEYFISNGNEYTEEIFISRRPRDIDILVEDEAREDIYYYKYHNRNVDWIDLVVKAIHNDVPQPEEDEDDGGVF